MNAKFSGPPAQNYLYSLGAASSWVFRCINHLSLTNRPKNLSHGVFELNLFVITQCKFFVVTLTVDLSALNSHSAALPCAGGAKRLQTPTPSPYNNLSWLLELLKANQQLNCKGIILICTRKSRICTSESASFIITIKVYWSHNSCIKTSYHRTLYTSQQISNGVHSRYSFYS